MPLRGSPCFLVLIAVVVVVPYGAETCFQPEARNYSFYSPKKGNYSVGDQIVYHCKQNRLTLLGHNQSECRANRQWSRRPPVCGARVQIQKSVIKFSENGATIDTTKDGNPTTCISLNHSWIYNELLLAESRTIRWIKIIHLSGALNVAVTVPQLGKEKPCLEIFKKEQEDSKFFECDATYEPAKEIIIKNLKSDEVKLCEVEIFTTASDLTPVENYTKLENSEKTKPNIGLLSGIVGAAVLMILFIVLLIILGIKRRKKRRKCSLKENNSYEMTTFPEDHEYDYASYAITTTDTPRLMADMKTSELYSSCQKDANTEPAKDHNSSSSRVDESNCSKHESLYYAYVSISELNETNG